jgi:hypothetical protein
MGAGLVSGPRVEITKESTLPFAIPKPRKIAAEGWQFVQVVGLPILDNQVVKKGTPNERNAVILRLKFKTVVPDATEQVDADAKADIFMYDGMTDGDSNWQYDAFLKAIGIESIKVPSPMGELEMLPDPAPEQYIGKKLKVFIKHDTYISKAGFENKNAIATKFEKWDGVAPTGKEIFQPTQPGPTVMGAKADKDNGGPLPF